MRFNPDIMPYLIELETKFTQYAISDIMDLNSKYAIVLYKWLCMNYNQSEYYMVNGKRNQQQLEEYQNPIISVKDLREMTDTVEEYKAIKDFSIWVLNRPLEEITKNTHFNVTYEKIKKVVQLNQYSFT
ncbi:replication initiation protein [Lactococcus lactis]|nr:replication initiation protein [Lactococcus lactis]